MGLQSIPVQSERDYLPFPEYTEYHGSYRTNSLNDQNNFYLDPFDSNEDESYAYARTVFENSSLNRVLAQGAQGEAFSPIEETGDNEEHVKQFEYSSNQANEVRYFTVGRLTGSLICSGYYDEQTLYKNTFVK